MMKVGIRLYSCALILLVCSVRASDPFAGQPRSKANVASSKRDFDSRQREQQQQFDQNPVGSSSAAFKGQEGDGSDKKSARESGGRAESLSLAEDDAVLVYAQGFLFKVLIAITSAITSSIIFTLMMKAVLSKTSIFVAIIFATGCSISCFTPGSFGDFSRALGVFTILLCKRSDPLKFAKSAFKQLGAAVLISGRASFPPVENPWRCKEPIDKSGVPFSMISTIVSILFMGAILGSMVPLLPNWLGALGGAGFLGYVTTTRNPRGDLLRFFGHSVSVSLSELSHTADDVYLREKTGVMLGRSFSFMKGIDDRFNVVGYVKAASSQIGILLSKIKSDMDNEDSGPRPQDRQDRQDSGRGIGARRRD
jgi:hypothetical protein